MLITSTIEEVMVSPMSQRGVTDSTVSTKEEAFDMPRDRREAGLNRNRQAERRLRCFSSVYFKCEGTLDIRLGCILDLCRRGVGFLVAADDCPHLGDQVWLRIADLPPQNSLSGMSSFTGCGRVLRCGRFSNVLRRVTVKFSRVLGRRAQAVHTKKQK